jgi:hypothetical protein
MRRRAFRFLKTCFLAAGAVIMISALPTNPAWSEEDPLMPPPRTTLSVDAGWEHLWLGDVVFGGKYDYDVEPSGLVGGNELQDGGLDGVRIDLALRRATHVLNWPDAVVGLKGFYAWHDASATRLCQSDASDAACDGTSLFDPDPDANNSLGSGVGETVTYDTDRDVRHWGVALEVAPLAASARRVQPRVGVAYRAIDQDMDLTSIWSLSANGQQYSESLDTGYLGAYLGAGGRHDLGPGLVLTVDAEAGVYWAHTDYHGALHQQDFSGSVNQTLGLDNDEAAVIAMLDLGLEKQLGTFVLAGFVRGEYYSYAPQMAYNQTDRSLGFPSGFSLLGPNDGTHIEDHEAWSLTVGGRVRIPFGSPS